MIPLLKILELSELQDGDEEEKKRRHAEEEILRRNMMLWEKSAEKEMEGKGGEEAKAQWRNPNVMPHPDRPYLDDEFPRHQDGRPYGEA